MPKKEGDPHDAYMMAPPQQLAEQAPHYSISGTASMPPPMPVHSMATSNISPFYASMSPVPPSSQQSQGPYCVQTSGDPLEQRILDLIYPYRDNPFNAEDDNALDEERKILMLCENIAFLIRHHQSSYGKAIEVNDVSIASRNWRALEASRGPAGVGIFVNGKNATHNIVRVVVSPGESVVESLMNQVDGLIQPFFPEV